MGIGLYLLLLVILITYEKERSLVGKENTLGGKKFRGGVVGGCIYIGK